MVVASAHTIIIIIIIIIIVIIVIIIIIKIVIVLIIIIMENCCMALFFIRNELTALGRAVSLKTAVNRRYFSMQTTRLVTLPFISTFILMSVIHRTLTWTTVCLTFVRDPTYACVYTRGRRGRGGRGHIVSE